MHNYLTFLPKYCYRFFMKLIRLDLVEGKKKRNKDPFKDRTYVRTPLNNIQQKPNQKNQKKHHSSNVTK